MRGRAARGAGADRAERPGPVVVLEPVPGGVAGGTTGLARRLNPRAYYLRCAGIMRAGRSSFSAMPW